MDVRLDEVVLRALEKEPERRYQQASQVKTDVETIATGSARKPAIQTTKTVEFGRRKRLKLGLVIAASCVAIGLAVWFFAARGGGDASDLTQQGWQLGVRGSWEEALRKFARAVKLDSRNPEAWNGLGWANSHCGKWREAEQAFQTTLALDPNHPAALNGLGQLCLMQRKFDLAESYLLKAATRAPAAWHGLAQCYLLQSKFDKAEEWAKKLMDSGYGDEFTRQLLQAARAKRLPQEPPFMFNPPASGR